MHTVILLSVLSQILFENFIDYKFYFTNITNVFYFTIKNNFVLTFSNPII